MCAPHDKVRRPYVRSTIYLSGRCSLEQPLKFLRGQKLYAQLCTFIMTCKLLFLKSKLGMKYLYNFYLVTK